jgi:hypothetical protein
VGRRKKNYTKRDLDEEETNDQRSTSNVDVHMHPHDMIHIKERKLSFSITFFLYSLIVLITPATFPHVPPRSPIKGVCALK